MCDKSISASKHGFKINSSKHTIVGHGINESLFYETENYKNKDRTTTNLNYVGRVSKIKNIHQILEALNILKNKFENIRFISNIYGDPLGKDANTYYGDLKKYCIENKLEKFVFFHKGIARKKLNKIYNQTDILISLSSTNSLDKVILEAMAAKKIVLTSNLAFKDILVANAYTSKCFLSSNNPELIAERIIDLINLNKKEKKIISVYFSKFIKKEHSFNNLIYKVQKLLKFL